MIVKIPVSGYVTLDLPPSIASNTEEFIQEWINDFSNWVKDAQEELSVPSFNGIWTYILMI